ncbi:MAG: hypothetical protein JWR10_4293 [Rubritepida sp.]|nr:hypothetical protein [Rubritepida sp.]
MPALNPPTITNGIAAAILFARGKVEGMALIAPGMEGARHSFLAALICLPVLLGLRIVVWAVQGAPPNGVAVSLAGELVSYTVGWVAFALGSKLLAERAQRGANWPQFITAWNWSNLVQYALLLVLLLPTALGLPGWIGNALGLAAVGYAMWLEWFVTRVALGVPGATAVMFVVLDLALGLFIGGVTARISGN